eukprot:Skav203162  [mRNA]  locus=scaffold371:106720:113570:+ [translate_table: standard]
MSPPFSRGVARGGCWYYHNEVTNVTAWELPTVLMRDRPPAPPKPWQLLAHAPSGRWYYHNPHTGETHWERPPRARRPHRSRSSQAQARAAKSPPGRRNRRSEPAV